MLLRRFIFSAVLSIAALSVVSTTHAQGPGFFGKSDDDSDFTGLYDPFCDLDTCWFEPIYCDCPERPLNSGWFFGYRRMRVSVSRPRNEPNIDFYEPLPPENTRPLDQQIISVYNGDITSDLRGDWAWGNRFDFGWMSEQGTGIWFVARKLDSPDERVQFDNIDLNGLDSLRLDNQPWGDTFATLNGLRMYGFEANKVWRLEPTAKGAIIEPFISPRYMRIRDHADRADVFSDAFDKLSILPITAAGGTVIANKLYFNYRETQMTTDNDLFGGQLGIRSRWRRGRWQISSDIRGLAFWNHQVKERITSDEEQQQNWIATYGGAAGTVGTITAIAPAGGGEIPIDFRHTQVTTTNNTFAYGGELNLEVAFEVTQGFAITGGAEILAIGDGIGRGRYGVDHSLVMSGFSFGFTFNR